MTTASPARYGQRLSHRETEVLLNIAHGHTAATCGDRLGINRHTVKTHMSRIRIKLGARTQTHALAIALRAGIIPVEAIIITRPTTTRGANQ